MTFNPEHCERMRLIEGCGLLNADHVPETAALIRPFRATGLKFNCRERPGIGTSFFFGYLDCQISPRFFRAQKSAKKIEAKFVVLERWEIDSFSKRPHSIRFLITVGIGRSY